MADSSFAIRDSSQKGDRRQAIDESSLESPENLESLEGRALILRV